MGACVAKVEPKMPEQKIEENEPTHGLVRQGSVFKQIKVASTHILDNGDRCGSREVRGIRPSWWWCRD
jgi:hypothetical protein